MSAPEHPIQVVLRDAALERSRVTVFFRLLLAIPHLIWLGLWTVGAVLLLPVAWVAALVRSGLPPGLHAMYASYVRYAAHVHAYVSLAADRYPGFLGEPGYAVDVEIAPPVPQQRWTIVLRLLLALPPLLLATVFTGASIGGRADSGDSSYGGGYQQIGLLVAAAVLAWFACLALGRITPGLRDLMVWCIGYAAQAYGYLFLLTDRYPDSTPALARPAPLPPHPVRVTVDDDLRRSRLTVAFRLLLWVPHAIWLTVWGIAALLAAVANWFAALATGRSPDALHRFIGAYVRYWTHVNAFLYLAADPFPGFLGRPGSYPLDLEVDAPARQHRAVTAFRILLAVPAFVIASGLQSAQLLAAVGGWFATLATGRMPRGLRDVSAVSTRYSAQLLAYVLVLTDRYPYAGPTLEQRPRFAPPEPPPLPDDWAVAPEAV